MFHLLARTAVITLVFLSFPAYAEVIKLGQLVSSNLERIGKLSVGMNKADVVKTMGTDNAKTKDGLVPNPWTTETFTGKDGAKYEVLYYVTRNNPPFSPIAKYLTTPVILKGGKVTGWGNDALEKVQSK
jgi:DhnA family fructose-bisphosphate aldolase class Ia